MSRRILFSFAFGATDSGEASLLAGINPLLTETVIWCILIGTLHCSCRVRFESYRMEAFVDRPRAGGRLLFGSDWPVASLDGMGRIYSIRHRGPLPGGTDQRLSLTTAIDHYIRECAYATINEKQKGMLVPGMLADIGAPATDVFSHEQATAADIAVKFTVFDGKVVYPGHG